MFKLAILTGVYSCLIFILGISGLFYKNIIAFISLLFLSVAAFLFIKINRLILKDIGRVKLKSFKNKIIVVAVLVILLQIIINLIGALGPETAFDALWYHLTLPKIYLLNHKIIHITGGLLYYSEMPKLTEMIYVPALAIGNEITAKVIHFAFGILSLFALYKLSRIFFSKKNSLFVLIIFYSNLVVAWESTTAYIDLARTFYEIMALWGFIKWLNHKDKKWFIVSALFLGFAISTKLLSIGSLFIFSSLIGYYLIKQKKKLLIIYSEIFIYWLISMFVMLPWLLFSFVNTGNPVYPFFTSIYDSGINFSLINPLRFLQDIWNIFTRSADPISPVYIISFPLFIKFYKSIDKRLYPIIIYSLIAILIWYVTPQTGGGRFMLPYLPAFSIIVVELLKLLEKNNKNMANLFIVMIIFIAAISIVYRGIVNSKYLPFIFGRETKKEFLSKNLNFNFGDFYDIDGYFEKNIKTNDKVLLYGFHNLYYVNFSFIDSSWVKKGEKFKYIAAQNTDLPDRFIGARMIYENKITKIKFYSTGGEEWVY